MSGAGGAFLGLADEMMAQNPNPPAVIDELDSLR